MKINLYKPKYGKQVYEYSRKKQEIIKQEEAIKDQIKKYPNEADMYREQLEAIKINAEDIQKKYDEYKSYLELEIEKKNMEIQMEQEKKSAEGAKEYAQEMSKVMMVARRMMKGDIVPLNDEKKLSEYDKELYKIAKNMQAMAQMMEKEIKKHKSLWDDEKKTEESPEENQTEKVENFQTEEVQASNSSGGCETHIEEF